MQSIWAALLIIKEGTMADKLFYYSYKYTDKNEIYKCNGKATSVLEITRLLDDKIILELDIRKSG